MKIEIINKVPNQLKVDNNEIKLLISSSLLKFGLTKGLEIEIIFVKESEIQNLNSQFRKKDCSTDVLSFPQDQFNLKKNILGSIVICPVIVEKKSESIVQVIKHGLLHLLSYDHDQDIKSWKSAAKKINCTY